MIDIERIQFYIPSIFEFHDNHSRRKEEDIKVVGVKKKYVEYFSGYREKEMTHIDQIVAEDFTVYDLQLDCNANLLSFYLEHEGESNQSKVLEKVFQTFIVEYNPRSFGYFTIAKGKHRPRTLIK
ncbi:hypothetical protein KD050_14630 [Psychrobacillus sp. INOP01]|uniref:hypothetical protein n=1 Tax=Psychrobacillus sp. INOP01 TaxID=2829187 RepID=UPI001BA5033C|nr:hypothetical protein [Psychrobacillus sp. INOP01]QUG40525.1 hypothetical protein KD050_14630 [Psychrobacillus sp. INOP01]